MQCQGPAGRCGQLLLLLTLLSPALSETSSWATDTFLDPSEDYEDLNGTGTTRPGVLPAPTDVSVLQPCYDDLCNDLPEPCGELAETRRCSCPGVAVGPGALPEAPVTMLWPDGEQVEVRWCAAHAYDTVYRVLVQREQVGLFGDLKRSMAGLTGVSAGAEVCVQAVNAVGESRLEGQACQLYEPAQGSPGLALKLGLIGGALALLVLLSIALLLWRRHSRKKGGARVNTDGPL